MDYYYKKTTDMLMNVSLPAGAAATTSITRNEGEMTNKGFEFAINSHNLTGEFSWDTDFNISFNKNKLTKLSLQKIYTAASSAEVVKENIVRNEPGRPLGGFYGYISDGVVHPYYHGGLPSYRLQKSYVFARYAHELVHLHQAAAHRRFHG